MKIVELPLTSLDLRYARLRARRPEVEKRLMVMIEEVGQEGPVIVVPGSEPGRYVLIEGRKRVRALERLKSDTVKAMVWEMAPAEALVAAFQLQDGTGWNVLEEGWLVWELVRGAGLSLGKVGQRLERSKAWVSGRLGLVEGLPEAVQEGVQRGKIGAYVATKHLLPFARANAMACERLAGKIAEQGLRSRDVEALWRYYGSAGRAGRERMLQDPARFLRVWEAAKLKGVESLGPEQRRCLKNLELVGGISLGLVRGLPPAAGYDAPEGVRVRLEAAWKQTQERFQMLEKTAAAVFEVGGRSVAVMDEADPHPEVRGHAG